MNCQNCFRSVSIQATIINQSNIQRLNRVMLNLIADMAVLKYEIDLLNRDDNIER